MVKYKSVKLSFNFERTVNARLGFYLFKNAAALDQINDTASASIREWLTKVSRW